MHASSNVSIPLRSTIQVACPPRLFPMHRNCEIVRSSFGKRYEGRKSIKYDTSCAVPAALNRQPDIFGPSGGARMLTLNRVHINAVGIELKYRLVAHTCKDALTHGGRCSASDRQTNLGSPASRPASFRGYDDPTPRSSARHPHRTSPLIRSPKSRCTNPARPRCASRGARGCRRRCRA